MAKRLFIVSDFSEEVTTDILEILESNEIPFYITPAGSWVASLEAVWLINDNDFDKAKYLLTNYFRKANVELHDTKNSYFYENRSLFQRIVGDPVLMTFLILTLIMFTVMMLLLL